MLIYFIFFLPDLNNVKFFKNIMSLESIQFLVFSIFNLKR